MSFTYSKEKIERGKADCIFCGKPMIEDGFIMQKVGEKTLQYGSHHYTLKPNKKFFFHTECFSKNLFQKDFPHIKVETSFFKYLEPARKSGKIIWKFDKLEIKEGCTQEEFDSFISKVAKRILKES